MSRAEDIVKDLRARYRASDGKADLSVSAETVRLILALLPDDIDDAERIMQDLATSSADDRRRVIDFLRVGYCMGCGTREPPRCHCEDDE